MVERLSPDIADDPTASAEWNNGCDFAMIQLCHFLGVDQHSVHWDAATETVDGDVQAVIGNILRAKFGDDWGPANARSSAGIESAPHWQARPPHSDWRRIAPEFVDEYRAKDWEVRFTGAAQPSLGHSELVPTPEQIKPILEDYFMGSAPEVHARCAQRIFDLCAVMSGIPITPSDNRISPISSTERRGSCQVCGETANLKCGPSRFGNETWACKDCWQPEEEVQRLAGQKRIHDRERPDHAVTEMHKGGEP